MLFMNEFLQQHWEGMRRFLQTVSNADTEIPMTSFDGYVDLPLRLAVLHGLLVDIIYQKDQVESKTNSITVFVKFVDLQIYSRNNCAAILYLIIFCLIH